MDHDDVLEQLELAAVEPGGLDRLAAGDTPTAAAVVGHLAGCASCAMELERLRIAAPLLRETIRTSPPTGMRERTLAVVRTRGVSRGLTDPEAAITTPTPRPGPIAAAGHGPRANAAWIAGIAAAVLLAFGAGALATRPDAARLDAQAQQIRGLERIAMATLTMSADPAVRRVALSPSAPGSATAGTLLFSPTTDELVVVATGLAPPPDGQEYRCWMELGGARTNVGRMFFAGELAYWVGSTPGVSDAPDGTIFGVSLSPIDGISLGADPVIAGDL